jgi:hypothetical protein
VDSRPGFHRVTFSCRNNGLWRITHGLKLLLRGRRP